MPRPIVAGIDGSREARAAAEWAAREALRRQRPLRLIHAGEGLPPDGSAATLPELRAPQDLAQQVLRTTAEQLTDCHPELMLTTVQVRRPPAPALISETRHAELLVLGNQGLGSVGGVLVGSVARATVGHAACPLVLVRAGFTAADERLPVHDGALVPSRDVTLAVDVAAGCEGVVEFAFREAELRRAPVRAVYVWHVPFTTAMPDPEHRAALRAEADRSLVAMLRPWREKFPQVPVRDSVLEGRPAHQVGRAARGAGLLVVGRRTRRRAVGSRTGPVAHALIHHAACPVAVVPHD
ncbi:universal stress protein [Streptomyces sp. NPDC050400]|uniref:universal stress protein n=1 Tax=Streptomyces sp. NPDC050400 TaxID=3365610 RepID=UPI0037AFFBEF